MSAPVILVEAVPRQAAGAEPVTVRLAGGGANVPYYYGGQHFRGGITGLPKSSASLDFDGEQLGGGGSGQAIALVWSASSRALLAEMAALYWDDAPIVVRVGAEGPDMPPVVARGLVLEAPADRGGLKIALADEVADLKRPLLVDRFAGTGGLEGPEEFADLIKSRAWGRNFNVPGRLLDAANQIWCFGDPYRRWSAFDQVRDKGVAADPSVVVVLEAGATAAATFAALQAAIVPQGGCVVCPSIACVKWWTEPAGNLHADIRGETAGGGYVETAPEIVARIVAARSALTFAPGTIAAAVAARPAPFGWRVDNDSATAAGEISEILGGVSLSWPLVDGAIVLRPWDWSEPTRVGRSFAVSRRSTIKPTASRKLGYRRNWSPMARGDLAAIVLVRDVIYDNGDSLADAVENAGKTADWDKVNDPDGTKPDPNATNSGDPASPFGPGKTVGEIITGLATLVQEMDKITETFGDPDVIEAARVAAEAARDAALVAASNSAAARDQSAAARDAAKRAQDLADVAAQMAQTARDAAGNSASAAAGSASFASASATESGLAAESATAQANIATTQAGEASAKASAAATSASSALGSSQSAASSASLSATAKSDAQLAVSATFPRDVANGENFTAEEDTRPSATPSLTAGRVEPNWNNTGRAIRVFDGDYGVGARNWLAVAPGRRYRVTTTSALHALGTGGGTADGVFLFGFCCFNAAGSFLGYAGAPQVRPWPYTGNIDGHSYEWSTEDLRNTNTLGATFYIRPYAIGLIGATGGQWSIETLGMEDVTSERQAAGSASASATSASSAAASRQGADSAAGASRDDRIAAQTARGDAEVFRNQAATSASGAAGSVSTASQQAGLAAEARNQAGAFAGASQTSSEVSTARANDAGASAAVATQQRQAADLSAQNAQTYAGQSGSFAATASASAAAARASSALAASVTGGYLNRNPAYGAWGDGQPRPDYYDAWGEAEYQGRAAGLNGVGFAAEFVVDTNQNGGFSQLVETTYGPQILDCRVELTDGADIVGAGLFLVFHQQGGPDIDGKAFRFATLADTGQIIDATHRRLRTYSFFMDTPIDGRINRVRIYTMANWDGFGEGRTRKRIKFHFQGLRPATEAERNAQRSLIPISQSQAAISSLSEVVASDRSAIANRVGTVEARVGGTEGRLQTVESVAANANGRVQSYWQKTATAGNGRAQITLYATDDNGQVRSGVDIVGDVGIHGSLMVTGSVSWPQMNIDDFATKAQNAWSGSFNGIGRTGIVAIPMGQVKPKGRFTIEYEIGLTRAYPAVQSQTLNGKSYNIFTDEDGGVSIEADTPNGPRYVVGPFTGSIRDIALPDNVTAGNWSPYFVVVLTNANQDTGVVDNGDYYTRNRSQRYTIQYASVKIVWSAFA